MGLNDTPRGSRLHIALFGRRNAGKSSLINALTNQDAAIVSAVAGTTTDPVYKAMEILPLGPVEMIDTAGLDDAGELGLMRIKKTLAVLEQTDLAIVVMTSEAPDRLLESELAAKCRLRQIPLVGVWNKIDQDSVEPAAMEAVCRELGLALLVPVSTVNRTGILELKQAIIEAAPAGFDDRPLLSDLIAPDDTVVLVTPIDSAAPKGRLILPQVQAIRDVLDSGALACVVRESELAACLQGLKQPPRLVVTDSQAFKQVAAIVPENIPLTSFSMLFARYKGDLTTLVAGAEALLALQPGDRVLISEGCTHHRQQDDIGTVKLPRLINKHIGGEAVFSWSSGHGFPDNLSQYRLVVHCGACMLNRREMLSRIAQVQQAGTAIVNYGIAIAALRGILPRALQPFAAGIVKE